MNEEGERRKKGPQSPGSPARTYCNRRESVNENLTGKDDHKDDEDHQEKMKTNSKRKTEKEKRTLQDIHPPQKYTTTYDLTTLTYLMTNMISHHMNLTCYLSASVLPLHTFSLLYMIQSILTLTSEKDVE